MCVIEKLFLVIQSAICFNIYWTVYFVPLDLYSNLVIYQDNIHTIFSFYIFILKIKIFCEKFCSEMEQRNGVKTGLRYTFMSCLLYLLKNLQ